MANERDLLSGEHFSVDGTLIQAWAGHKSFVRKYGSDDGEGGNFKGDKRSNDTHASNTDADVRLYRKVISRCETKIRKIKIPKRGLALAQGIFQQPAHAARIGD